MRRASLAMALTWVWSVALAGCVATVRVGGGDDDGGLTTTADAGPSQVADAARAPEVGMGADTGPTECQASSCPACALGQRRVADGTCCGHCAEAAVSRCGDGVLQGSEVCDDGNVVSGDGCNATCTAIERTFICPSPGKPCVLANPCANVICADCEPDHVWVADGTCCGKCVGGASRCGDGVLQPGEVCDDGNALGGDGCSADCARIDAGYVCNTPGLPCVGAMTCTVECDLTCPVGTRWVADGSCCGACSVVSTSACGNGLVEATETCDDANTLSGDGCSASCQIEVGYICWIDIARNALGTLCAKGPLCTPGADQTCNDNVAISSLLGRCGADGVCVCREGAGINTATGKCMDCSAYDCPRDCPTGTRRVADGTCCGRCEYLPD